MRQNTKKSLVCIVFIFFATITFSQSYLIYHYGKEHGLASSDVLDVIQDDMGVMWFATRAGISSYDGYSWTNYSNFTPINTTPAIIKMVKDNNGNIYCVTAYLEKGYCIYRFNKNKWEKVTSIKLQLDEFDRGMELTLNAILIKSTKSGIEIVLGLDEVGIAIYNNGLWSLITKSKGKSFSSINGIVMIGGRYLIASDFGLFEMSFNQGNSPSIELLPLLKGKKILGIAKEKHLKFSDKRLEKDKIWIVGQDFLGYFYNVSQNSLSFSFDLIEKNQSVPLKIFPDYYGGLYVLRVTNFWYFNSTKNTFELQNDLNGFASYKMNNVFVDFEKIMWLVGPKGVDKLISKVFESYTARQGVLGDEATAICKISKTKMVVGHRFGISILNNGLVEKKIVFKKLIRCQGQRVLDIAIDRQGVIWCACGGAGLIYLDKKNKLHSISETHVSSVEILPSGKVLVGTTKGLKVVNGTSLQLINKESSHFEYIRNLFTFNSNDVYCASSTGGVYLVKESGEVTEFLAKKPENNSVYFMYKDSKQRILLGTLGGLCIIKNRMIMPFKAKDINFNYPIYSIAEDKRGNIWLGTDIGVVKWYGTKTKFYSKSLGVIGEEANRNAIFIDDDSSLWIGTNNGLCHYNNEFDSDFVYNTKPLVKIISVGNDKRRELVTVENNSLNFETGNINIEFNLISFVNETQNKFYYKLNKGDWEKVSYPFKPLIRTRDLQSGNYIVSIKGVNANGIESDVIFSPEIIIKRSLLFSRFVQILLGLIVVLISWLLYFKYFAKRRAKFLEQKIQERVKELQLTNKKYRELFEGSFDGIYYADLDGKFIDINDTCVKILGYKSKEEAIKLGSVRAHYVDLKNREEIIKELFKNGYINNYKLGMRTATKEKKVVSISAVLIKGVDNKPVGFRGIVKDITEKEKLKEQLYRSQKMEAIGILAGGVAHDLNNILAGLTTYPEILLMQIGKDSPLVKPIKTIKSSGEKAAAMVQDLLTMARRGIEIKNVINLNSVIEEYFESPEFKKVEENHKNVVFEMKLEPEIVTIKGSKVHMLKCIMNLVSNGAEAITKKGKVLVRTQNCSIENITTNYEPIPEGEYVVVSVEDNGSGMSNQDMKRIFEPFYTKKIMGKSGTGLGMGVVWATVKDAKGYVDVISTEGKGSTIKLFFPASGKSESIEEETVDLAGLRGFEKLLVVDDIEEQRDGAKMLLSNLGYDVISISSGERCVEYLKTNEVDLVLLDMIMDPGIDGYETYKKIIEFNPNQKAIIVSGFAEGERIEKVKSLGVEIIVKKPYSVKSMGFAVRKALNK